MSLNPCEPNLDTLCADRRAGVQPNKVEERARQEVQKVFDAGYGIEKLYFPETSDAIADRPRLTLVVLPPGRAAADAATRAFVDTATREHGSSARTFQSALVWAVPESSDALRDKAQDALAWEEIASEQAGLQLDEAQQRQLAENVKNAQRDVRDAVWRAYKNVMLLGKDNGWKTVDLGLIDSSAARFIVRLILDRLRKEGDYVESVSPSFLVSKWPPALKEWSTKAVRDAFFTSPQLPRLAIPEAIKNTIAIGVDKGVLAYVGKEEDGGYYPFYWEAMLAAMDVEISDDLFIIQREEAQAYRARKTAPARASACAPAPARPAGEPGAQPAAGVRDTAAPAAGSKAPDAATVPGISWKGEVPPEKWTSFYAQVLSRLSTGSGLKLTLSVELAPPGGVSAQKIEETKAALRELGLGDELMPRGG